MARFTQNAGGTGSALNYVQVAGSQQTISAAPSSIIGLTITTTGKPVQISVTGEGSNAGAESWVRINLFRNGTAIGNEMQLEASAVSENVPYAINFIDEVGAGTYNYTVDVTAIAGGNWQFGEAAGPVMNAVELTGFKGDTGAQGPAGADGTGGDSGPKTWTAPNDSLYQIKQAHGGIEVILDQPYVNGDVISIVGNFINQTQILVTVPEILSGDFGNAYNGAQYFRRLTMDLNGITRNFRITGTGPEPYQWYLESLNGPVTVYNGNGFYANLESGGIPTLWWDANELGLIDPNDSWQFRGAKIEYHAYSQDSGTMIGTVYIASDNGDNNVTHIETNSGANDVGNVVLWNRYGNEAQLYAYRTDTEGDTIKIHWTAQIYYGTEYYD